VVQIFVVKEEECRPYPLRFLIAQSLSMLAVLKLGFFLLVNTEGFNSFVDNNFGKLIDTVQQAAYMQSELRAQEAPLLALCEGSSGAVPEVNELVAVQGPPAAVAADPRLLSAFKGQQSGSAGLCGWREQGVTGQVVSGGTISSPPLDYDTTVRLLDELSEDIKMIYPYAVAVSLVVGVLVILASYPIYQSTVIKLRQGKVQDCMIYRLNLAV
jgi:hypothetical protein